MKKVIIFSLVVLLLIANVNALYVEESSKISFGHVLRVKSINVSDISPGESGSIKINLKNSGDYSVTDLRAKLTLPSQVQFLNDVNEIRVAEIMSGETKDIEYKIIALPSADEGIYGATLLVNYVTHYGVNAINFGNENQDNYTLGIMIKSNPSIFMQLDSTDLYKGKNVGDITLKFVNNGTSNIKFLTVNLIETGDYEVISDDKNYIGDLDSDDFQSATFNIKLKTNKDSIKIPVKISYRDSMNNLYSKELSNTLKIKSAADAGVSNGGYIWGIIIIVAIIIGTGYYFYKKKKRKKDKFRV